MEVDVKYICILLFCIALIWVLRPPQNTIINNNYGVFSSSNVNNLPRSIIDKLHLAAKETFSGSSSNLRKFLSLMDKKSCKSVKRPASGCRKDIRKYYSVYDRRKQLNDNVFMTPRYAGMTGRTMITCCDDDDSSSESESQSERNLYVTGVPFSVGQSKLNGQINFM